MIIERRNINRTCMDAIDASKVANDNEHTQRRVIASHSRFAEIFGIAGLVITNDGGDWRFIEDWTPLQNDDLREPAKTTNCVILNWKPRDNR